MTWSPSTRYSPDATRAVGRRARTWFDQEQGWFAAVLEMTGALRQGLRRRALIVGVSGALSLLAMLALVATRRDYAPRYVLRVVETDHDPGVMPRLKRQLAAYVQEAVFTSAALMPLIQRHRLYPRLASPNPRIALESFREDIDVEVYENYFVEERTTREAPRSARVAVSYRASDPDLALAVTRDLGRLIAERERRLRRAQAAAAVDYAENLVDRRSRALSRLRRQIIDKQLEIDGVGPIDPRTEVELVSLFGAMGLAERELDKSEKRHSELELALALERSGNGLRFEVADDGDIPRSTRLGARQLGGAGAAAFLLCVPFVSVLLGASRKEGGGR
jgi:hypothetical protein